MFPMTAKTIMTEEAYRRFAWTNFWYKKNGLFSLILPEIVVLICGAICFFHRGTFTRRSFFLLLWLSFLFFTICP